MCMVRRDDGAQLFVRHSYRSGWGVPGGLLKRGEEAADAVQRETLEEVGLRVVIDGPPIVVVAPRSRRVDVIFRCRPADGSVVEVSPSSPEILEARWFGSDDPPPDLQKETARALRELQPRSEH
jgi:8-oxo-dGTP pyrophosphatase MutT (NUDIX family)